MTNYRDNFNEGKITKISSYKDYKQRGVPFTGSANVPDEIESDRFMLAYKKQMARYLPSIDHRNPSEFCQFGSAERYYTDSFNRIVETYPYDGSRAEKIEWSLSSSVVDLYLLEHEYPKATGHVSFHRSLVTDDSNYPTSTKPQYIKFSGGPHKGTVYNSSKNRESNLKIDGSKGNTVEFWMKKESDSWHSLGGSRKEVVADIVTSKYSTAGDFGRMLVELESTQVSGQSPLLLTYLSGTTGLTSQRIGSSNITTSSIADGKWHHYAISATTVGTNTEYKLYIDGLHDSTTTAAHTLGPVDRPISGALGALAAANGANGSLGAGMLSASLDEFRFWKTSRDEKQIGKNWYKPIHGGTDSDHSNASLGLYYKFNEGKAGSANLDKIVLDYSGRINNGTIVNYESGVRSLESAINLSEYLPTNDQDYTEKGDPIIVDGNSLITTKLRELQDIGKEYDFRNNNSLFFSLPQFIRDQDQEFFPELLQIMASVLDDLYLKILHLPKLKDYYYEDFFTARGSAKQLQVNNFFFGCDSQEEDKISGAKTRPWVEKTLQHFGFVTPEIFQEATIQEYFNQATDNLTFDQKLSEVKNIILSNIHKNLVHIYNTKGTESSFRNMLRCFGVDTDLIKFNVYTDNESREVLNDIAFETVKQKSINFLDPLNSGATIYSSASSDTDSRGYVTGSIFEAAYTMETNVILPAADLDPDITKASVFGIKTVDGSFDLAQQQGSGSFEVFCVRPSSARGDAYFLLTSSYHMFQEITSSTFTNTYNNEHWNISVKVSRDSDIEGSLIPAGSSEQYKVEFSGYNYDLDLLQESFHLSSSVAKANYDLFNSANKYAYLGAEREQISGSILNRSNVRVLGSALWLDKLSEEEFKIHAQNSSYFGRKNPSEISKYNSGQNIIASDSSIFRWQFENLSESNSTGFLTVQDLSSGSLSRAQSMDGGSVIGYKHPAQGINFGSPSSAVEQEFLPLVKISPIGNRYSSRDVNIINTEIEKFTADSRPVSKKFTFEKSMYQILSETMLEFFSGITGFNTLIGATVNKYRQDYKALKVLRERFFSKVENTIELDRFVDYYRWMDDSISQALAQLLPASANISDNLRNTVESHMLERNKYQHPAPTLEFKMNEDIHSITGVNELIYNWKLGHADFPRGSENSCLWEKEREEVSIERQKIKQALTTVVSGSTYARRALVKPYRFGVDIVEVLNKNSISREFYKSLNGQKSIEIRPEEITERKTACTDLQQDKNDYEVFTRVEGDTLDSDVTMPFTFISESGFSDLGQFKSDLRLTNINTRDRSVLQGPFTRQHEGIMSHETVKIGSTTERPEGYNLDYNQNALTMSVVDTHLPRSIFNRGMGISTPYTVRNIKNDNQAGILGNYDKSYDIVQIHGKSSNNKDLKQQNPTVNHIPSDFIAGIADYTRTTGSGHDHVFVSRFSSPGGPEVAGNFARDPEAGEYSIYSTVNYRNEIIRDAYNDLSTEYSEQFGYRSGSSTVGSIHKTNRNPTRIITEVSNDSQYDNFFKQREIPATDFGYAWITASANEGVYSFLKKNANFSHQGSFFPGTYLLNDSSSALYFDANSSLSYEPYVRFPDDDGFSFSSIETISALYVADFNQSSLARSVVVADDDAFSFVQSGSARDVTAVANFSKSGIVPALSYGIEIRERTDREDQTSLAHSGAVNENLAQTIWPNAHTVQHGARLNGTSQTIRYTDTSDYYAIATQSNDTFNAQYVRFPGGVLTDTATYPATYDAGDGNGALPAEHSPYFWASESNASNNQYLSFVNSTDTAEVSFTISFWMRAASKNQNRSILSKWGTNSEYYVSQESRNIKLSLRSGNISPNANNVIQSYTATNILSSTADVWEHIVITYDVTGNQIKFYKDGALHGTPSTRNANWQGGASATYRMALSGNPFRLGKVTTPANDLSNRPFDGDISNVSLFKHDGSSGRSSKVLTLSDVEMLYNNGRIYDYSNHSKYEDMLCWWPLSIRNIFAQYSFPNSGSIGNANTLDLWDGRKLAYSAGVFEINNSPDKEPPTGTPTTWHFNQATASVSTAANQHQLVTDGVLKGVTEFENRAFAVAFWMKKETDDTGGADKIIVSKQDLWRITQNDRKIRLWVRDSSFDIEGGTGDEKLFQTSGTFLDSVSQWDEEPWELVIVEFYKDGSNLKAAFRVFRDGGLVSSEIDSALVGQGTLNVARPSFGGTQGGTYGFGFNGHPSLNSWNGILSNVATFIRPNLTDKFTNEEAAELYNNGYAFDWRRFSLASQMTSYAKLNKVPSSALNVASDDAYDYIREVDPSAYLSDGGNTGQSPYLNYRYFEDRRFLMSFWIRFHDLTGVQHIIYKSHDSDPSKKQYELRKDANNRLVLELFDQRPLSRPSSANPASISFTGSNMAFTDLWYHVVVTYDPQAPQLESHDGHFASGYNNIAKFYVNNTYVAQDTPPEATLDYVSMVPPSQDPGNQRSVYIGGKNPNNLRDLKASLAEVLVVTGNIDHSKAFTSTDVNELYNDGFVWDQRSYSFFESASYYYKFDTDPDLTLTSYKDLVPYNTNLGQVNGMTTTTFSPGTFGVEEVDGLQSKSLVSASFAIGAWVYKDTTSGDHISAIASKFEAGTLDDPTGAPEFVFYKKNRDIFLRVYDLTGIWGGDLRYREATVSNFFSDATDEWEHVTVVRDIDNERVTFYKNGGSGAGAQDGATEVVDWSDLSTTLYREMQNTTSNLIIGNTHEGGPNYFEGNMSNVIIFKQTLAQTALDDTDVANLYNNGAVFDYSTHAKYSQAVAWWKLDNQSPRASNDSVAAEQVSGLTGSFKAISGFMTKLDDAAATLPATVYRDKSFSVTFRMRTTNTAKQYFMGKKPSSGNIEYTGYIHNNNIVIKFAEDLSSGGKTYSATTSTTSLCDGKWHQVLITYSHQDDTMDFYVDGLLESGNVPDSVNNASYESMVNNNGLLYIGNAAAAGYNPFSGSLSDFAIYRHDGALGRSSSPFTANEALLLYNGGNRVDYNHHSKSGDLTGWWQLGGHKDSSTNLEEYSSYRGLTEYSSIIDFSWPSASDGFIINVPIESDGTGQNIEIRTLGTLTAGTVSGRANSSLSDNRAELFLELNAYLDGTTQYYADVQAQRLADRLTKIINGTGANEFDSVNNSYVFQVSENLTGGIPGIIAEISNTDAKKVTIKSTSRQPEASLITFVNNGLPHYIDTSVQPQTEHLASDAANRTTLLSNAGVYPDQTLRNHSSETISFLKRPEKDLSVGFVPNNYVITSSIDENTNVLSVSSETELNSMILSRQGPYGWPSWKQMRGSEHPITRNLRNNSQISIIVDGPGLTNSNSRTGYNFDYHPSSYVSDGTIQVSGRKVRNYTEPFVLQSYNPVVVNFYEGSPDQPIELQRHKQFQDRVNNLPADDPLLGNLEFDFKDTQKRQEELWTFDASLREFSNTRQALSFGMIKTSYENDLVKFSNKDIVDVLGMTNKTKHHANIFIRDIKNEYNKLIQFSFKQDIFPKSENTFLVRTRERQKFDFPWKKSRSQREIILTGSLSVTNPPSLSGYYIYPKLQLETRENTRTLNSMGIDLITHASFGEQDVQSTKSQITSSIWPLDARRNYSLVPQAINGYFSTNKISVRGQEGQGELQNDYSTYHEGLNSIFVTAPPAMTYNRRVVQDLQYVVTGSILAGEAKWLAAEQIGSYPFKDQYGEDAMEIRSIAKQYSIVPEYRISDFIERLVTGSQDTNFLDIGRDGGIVDFISLTGSSASDFSDIIKDYSTSDMMESFGLVLEHNEGDISPIKITLRCDAAIKFVPYEGFYPAQRVLQLGRLFSNNYLSHLGFQSTNNTSAFGIHNANAFSAKKRANLQQVSKVLFSPGVLLNSIKSGVAVDYPIFDRLEGHATGSYDASTNPVGLLNRPSVPLTGSGPYVNAGYLKTNLSHRAEAHTHIVGVTGSFMYLSEDDGIPRISGSLSSRITFDDLLNPATLEGRLIHDNEPHPSASLLLGNHYWEALIDRPFKFGQLDVDKVQQHLGGNVTTVGSFERSLLPFSMAINNFCAETTDLFVDDGLTTFEASAPSVAEYQEGTEYRMRLTFENRGVMMYDRHSAFGPPVDEGDVQNYLSQSSVVLNTPGQPATLAFTAPTDGSFSWNSAYVLQYPGFSFTTNIGTQTLFRKTVNFKFYQGIWHDIYGVSHPASGLFSSFTNDSSTETIDYYMDVNTDTPGNLINAALDAWLATGGGKTPRFTKHRTTSHGTYLFAITQDVIGSAGNTALSDTGLVPVWGNLLDTISPYVDSNGDATFKYGADASSTPTEAQTLVTVAVTGGHGYLPYVPPFLDKGTKPYVEFAFKPTAATGGTKLYTLSEVFENLQITSSNNISATYNNGGTNLLNAMNLGASLDYKAYSVYEEDQILGSDSENLKARRWVIQTKWETPVMDFSEAQAEITTISESGDVSNIKSATSFWKERDQSNYYRIDNLARAPENFNYITSSRGMWHQAGQALAGARGYEISLDDVAGYESLGKKVNLLSDVNPKRTKRVGRLVRQSKLKNISEAVVAVPYYFEDGGTSRKFFDIKTQWRSEAAALNTRLEKESTDARYTEYYNDPGSTPVESTAYHLRMLDKYVFPPMFDVNRFDEATLPFMFIFQFNGKFTQDDLSNIWQNVSPTSRESGAKARFSYGLNDAPNTVMDTKYVSLFLDNLFNHPIGDDSPKDFIEQKVRWLVFKVKQRAKTSMSKQKEDSLPGLKSGLKLAASSFGVNSQDFIDTISEGSYNWPYDYFSIVELIKIGAKTDYKN